MQSSGNTYTRKLDWITVLLYLILVVLGWLTIYAANYDEQKPFIFNFAKNYGRQMIFIGMAVVISIAIIITDSKFFPTFAYVIYGLVLLLNVAVLVAGHRVNGAISWFEIGGFQLQPAELAKFATLLALAKYMSSQQTDLKSNRTRFVAIALFAFPAALIVLQGDAGSALIYAVVFIILYRFGMSGYILLLGIYLIAISILALVLNKIIFTISIGVIMAVLFYIFRKRRNMLYVIGAVGVASILYIFAANFVFNKVLEPHQQRRISVLLGKHVSDVKDADYNVKQSKTAIGSGGFAGKGYLKGTLTQYNFVPEQSTDFIFCTIGEEGGFIFSSLIIILFIALIGRILLLAERQRSLFSKVYGYGVAAILFFHVAINVGMTIGLAPVIGIPLPFFSYGGSALLDFTVLLFILVKLDSDRLAVIR
jgi:rod shape determining protein RodA